MRVVVVVPMIVHVFLHITHRMLLLLLLVLLDLVLLLMTLDILVLVHVHVGHHRTTGTTIFSISSVTIIPVLTIRPNTDTIYSVRVFMPVKIITLVRPMRGWLLVLVMLLTFAPTMHFWSLRREFLVLVLLVLVLLLVLVFVSHTHRSIMRMRRRFYESSMVVVHVVVHLHGKVMSILSLLLCMLMLLMLMLSMLLCMLMLMMMLMLLCMLMLMLMLLSMTPQWCHVSMRHCVRIVLRVQPKQLLLSFLTFDRELVFNPLKECLQANALGLQKLASLIAQ